jgi:hypothetical protein
MLVPDGAFVAEQIPLEGNPSNLKEARQGWLGRVVSSLEQCDVIFLDPDNGLEPDGFSFGSRAAGKSVAISELVALARPGRTLIVYHHHTRRPGGHLAEIDYWRDRLTGSGFGRVDALRCRAFSPRCYFFLNGSNKIAERADQFAQRWPKYISWHSHIDAL